LLKKPPKGGFFIFTVALEHILALTVFFKRLLIFLCLNEHQNLVALV